MDERVLDAIYDPALRGGDWRPALCALRELLKSADVAFTILDPESSRPRLWETTGAVLAAGECETYERHYMRLDPKRSIFAANGHEFLFNDTEHFDDAFVARDPFYQEYSRPLGIRHTLDLYVDAGKSGDMAERKHRRDLVARRAT